MSVPYILGDDFRPEEGVMDTLIGSLDAKLSTILYNKSPILALNVGLNGFPGDLLGKCFFFVDPGRPSKWAYRCPGAKVISGTKLYPYDHTVFTNAENAATGHSYDLGSFIVSVNDFASGQYGSGLTKTFNVGLFDHSLRAHRRGGVTSFKAKTFFYKETTEVAHAERYCDRGLAELILEGVSSVSIPDTYDKYLCFRIHNLNYAPATVTFGSGVAPNGRTVTVPALGCAVVRRDRTIQTETFLQPCTFSNYRVGPLNYFFQYEPGDFRHFWFFPTSYIAGNNVISQQHAVPWNSMAANNLANPAIIYDWVRAFKYNYNDWILNSRGYAWFHVDAHEVCDESDRYSLLMADPSNQSANLGDLVFHKGKVMLLKIHKTNKLFGSQLPDVEWQEIQFNGFDTLAADWAPYGIDVVTIANSQIEIRKSASVTDWDYMLVPFGTNLLRGQNETIVGGRMLPYRIDPHWFDQQADAVSMHQNAPQLLVRRTIQETANTQRHFRYAPSEPSGALTITNTGDPKRVLSDIAPPANTFTTMWAPQAKTVGELLQLNFFGDKNFSTQDTPYTVYTEARVVLTPHGHVLLFYEEIPAELFQVAENDLSTLAGKVRFGEGWELRGERMRRKRSIPLRGNGFGYPQEGRISAMFHSPRYGSRVVGRSEYLSNVQGVSGADYRVQRALSRETDVKVLRRVKSASLANGSRSGRFWQHSLRDSLEAFRVMTAGGMSDQSKVLVSSSRTQLLSTNGLSSGLMTYQLLPEHYNGLAQIVNQCKTGKQLDYRALRFEVTALDEDFSSPTFGQMVTSVIGITPPQEFGDDANVWPGRNDSSAGSDRNYPVPAEAFDYLMATANSVARKRFKAYEQAGIPIRSVSDLPEWADALTAKNKDRKIWVKWTAEVTGATATGPDQSDHWEGNVNLSLEHHIETPDSARAPGTAFVYNMGGFARLQDVYQNFKYVAVEDVESWLAPFGLPFVFDDLFMPLELRVVQSSSAMSNGAFHEPTRAFTGKIVDDGRKTSAAVNKTFTFNADGEDESSLFRDVECLAFAPVVDTPNGTLWKAPLAFGRTIQNKKFWNDGKPVFFILRAMPQFANDLGGGVQFQIRGLVPSSDFDQEPACVYLEFGESDDEDHTLWMQMNWRLVAPLAFRSGSGSSASIVLVHRDFWMDEVDVFSSSIERAMDSLIKNGEGSLSAASGAFYSGGMDQALFQEFTPEILIGGQNARPWHWVTSVEKSAPEISSGVNLLPVELTGDYGVQFYANFVGAFPTVSLE